MNLFRLLSIPVLFWLASCQTTPQEGPVVSTDTGQVILVITPDPDAFQGTMTLFERPDSTTAWQTLAREVPVVIGKNGLGWGQGRQPSDIGFGLPDKKEGDGRSPAGVFSLSEIFGFTPEDSVEGIKMPYRHVNDVLECVDDSHSRFYNQLIYRDAVDTVDWNSSEKMLQIGRSYHLGVMVDHNTMPVVPEGGSCIFIHIWNNDNDPTIGCTAMSYDQMQALANWLDPEKHPLLVQMTGSAYLDLQIKWSLPKL